MQLGYPYHERLEALDLATPSDEPDWKEEFQGTMQRFTRYRVPIGLPKYRLNNGRTGAAQEEYIKLENKPDDYFSADAEIDEVQKAQHDILTKMIEESSSGLSELFSSHSTRQNEPLILMHDGTVANGNRRLTLMRNLLVSDPTNYSHFTHIDIIRLPQAEEIDIARLEAHLQLKKDVKEQYGWVSRAILVRKAIELGMSHTEAASLYEYKDDKEARKMVRTLELAETYLDVRDRSKEYSKVKDDMYAFLEIEKLASKQKTWSFEKTMKFQQLCWGAIDNPSRMGGRVMSQIRDFHSTMDQIIDEVEQEHSDFIISESGAQEGSSDIDLLGGTDSSVQTGKLWNEIGESEADDELMTTVHNTIQRVKAQEKAAKTDRFVFNRIKEADKIIQNIVKNKQSGMSKEGVAERITSIETKLNNLKEWVRNG
tara:strand:- start:2852 stop:4132 length:1281 start_codon:yes stop_codon:yes gene_type:complete